jgi:alanine dehydrogenase
LSLLYLTREQVAGLLPEIPAQLDLVEETYAALAAGRVELPPKPGVHPRENSFIHAMPAYLADQDVAALKWVSGYPGNKARGLPYISGVLVLNDAETGLPLTVMDAAEITAARTAAASGVCIRRWAPDGWSTAAILGCGEQGRFHARLLNELNPDVTIRAFDPHPERCARLEGRIEQLPDVATAVQGAEVVVSAAPIVEEPQPPISTD